MRRFKKVVGPMRLQSLFAVSSLFQTR
ncbi:hypothetical protein A2U01_0044215, partial [Trifolium medium]|nr:hypothetical protein [Trifolium medium]